MPENTSTIAPLDWRGLVREAIRRRKAEKLTQREHAALASVSIPTIAAFDRGETTVSLAKAFDILRVVGLLAEPAEDGAQEAFVRDALARWRALASGLPEKSAGRLEHGQMRIDYALEGDLKKPGLAEFGEILRQAVLNNTGWPMFLHLTRPELAPREADGGIECWVRPEGPGIERFLRDAAHCDFWRCVPEGRFFLLRGLAEDSVETFAPATILDSTLPIWRLGEGLSHAARVAGLMKETAGADVTIRFRALYAGLAGRVLRAWASPMTKMVVEGRAAVADEALLETTVTDRAVRDDLTGCVYPLVAALYERFGVTGLSADRVQEEILKFQKSATNTVL